MYLWFRQNPIDMKKFSKCCFINSMVMTGFLVLELFLNQITDSFVLPLFGNSLFFQENARETASFRFQGFLEYPTLIVAFTLLMLPFAGRWVCEQTPSGKRLLTAAAYFITAFLPVYFCYSRSGYVLMAGWQFCSFFCIVTKFMEKERFKFY